MCLSRFIKKTPHFCQKKKFLSDDFSEIEKKPTTINLEIKR